MLNVMVSPLSPKFGPFMCEQREVEKKRKKRWGGSWRREREKDRQREKERQIEMRCCSVSEYS